MRKKLIIKIILISIMILGVISFSFALNNVDANTLTDNGPSFINRVTDLLNIVWLPFAVVAGKLFSNDLVYGSLLGIDSILWKVWSFSRMLANYTIGFIFIIGIFGYFVGKVKNIFSLLGKIVISSVLVNMSWFLLAVIIDLSTILLAAAGSLPMHLMGTSTTGPMQKIKYCSVIEIDPITIGKNVKEKRNITVCKEGSEKEINTEDFFSKMNSLTGPLIFIGTSILNIDKNWDISPGQIKNNDSIKKSAQIRRTLHTMIVLLFVVPIVLLVIIGIIRVFWLWIYIAFSPLLVLDYVFGGKVAGKNKNFKIANVIGLIFQPVLVVMGMGISIIFLATVQTAFIGGDSTKETKKELGICGKDDSSLCIGKKTVVTIKGNLENNFMEDVGGIFGYIIITILSFVLVWGILKLAFSSTEITSSIAENTFKFAEEGLKAVPIIPTKAGGVGIGAIEDVLNKGLIKSHFADKATKDAEKMIGIINNTMGIGKNSIGPSIKSKYIEMFKDHSKDKYVGIQNVYKKFLEDVIKNKPDVIPETDLFFKEVTLAFLKTLEPRDNLRQAFKLIGVNSEKEFKKLLSSPDELFNNNNFKRVLSGIIKNPNLLGSSQIDHIFNLAKNEGTNLLANKIGNIK